MPLFHAKCDCMWYGKQGARKGDSILQEVSMIYECSSRGNSEATFGFCADNAEANLDTVSSWEIKGIGKSCCFNCLGVCDQS